MAWVEHHNEITTNRLEADPRYARNYSQALESPGPRTAFLWMEPSRAMMSGKATPEASGDL